MKSTMMKDGHPRAIYEESNSRFKITPLLNGRMSLPDAVRAMKECTIPTKGLVTWKFIARFFQINQSDAFKLAYATKRDSHFIRKALEPYLVIDEAAQCAYVYDYAHKPAGVVPKHIGPSIINGEADTQEVIEKIPTRISTRISVKYPFTKSLVMSLKPTNGYLLGIRDIVIAQPNAVYKVTGSAGTLTDLLRRIHFVAVEPGDASLLIAVDDGTKEVGGVASTEISLTVVEGETISIPELHLPEEPKANLMEESSFDAITVSDEDDKMMQLRMTPFGCKILNFKNTIHPLLPGEVRNIYGRPETINDDIANLSIVPFQVNAQIGVELICGSTTIRQYVVFDVAAPDEGDEEDENHTLPQPDDADETPENPSNGTEEPQGQGIAVQSDEDPEAIQMPVMQSTVETISGLPGAVVAMPLTVTNGEDDQAVTLILKPIRCTLTDTINNKTIAHNKSHTLQGTITAVNTTLQAMQVNVGTQEGRIDMTLNGNPSTIQVVIIPTESEQTSPAQ